jgi:branched-chain amino acid transport system permease protein
MSTNRWLATGNFLRPTRTSREFLYPSGPDHLHLFSPAAFAWPLLFTLSNKYMLVFDNILIAMVAIIGLNIVTGFAGLISIGHAAFVGIGAYTVASFSRTLGDSHVIFTHAWPLMIVLAGLMGAVFGAIVGLPAMRLKHLYLAIATLSFPDDIFVDHQLSWSFLTRGRPSRSAGCSGSPASWAEKTTTFSGIM